MSLLLTEGRGEGGGSDSSEWKPNSFKITIIPYLSSRKALFDIDWIKEASLSN